MKTQLIIALDFSNRLQALTLTRQINPELCALKIGNEMFTLFGTSFVRELVEQGFKIFLDLKYHDIPTTVARACSAAAELGVWMLNVHISGGLTMLRAAREALNQFDKEKRPLLIGVTVLTSMDSSELMSVGITRALNDQVNHLAKLAHQAGLDGIVCSAHEVPFIKAQYGSSFLTVTPGIRLKNDNADDQRRIMTPQEASKNGSDYLVIGRSITQAENPSSIIEEIVTHLA